MTGSRYDMPLNEGERVGPYEVLGTLGLGGMGDMLRALDHRTDREVAIQVLKQTSPNADHQNRFVQEARAASALNHPNVVTIYDVGIEDGTPYIVSELVGGESLRAVMMRRSLSLEKI